MRNILILLLILPLISFAQQQVFLSGYIINSDGSPAVYSTISLKGTKYVTQTDERGKFSLKAPTGDYILTVSMIGMEVVEHQIQLIQNTLELPTIILKAAYKHLEEVSVQGKTETQRLKEEPIKAEIIDMKPLQMEAASLAESMNRAAGIRIRQTGGLGSQSSIFVNGFTGKAVKFFKDDIPLDYLGESFNLSMLPINMLERVEIYKGVMPTKLGADALGGAVNYVTKSNAKNYLDLSYEHASFNTQRASFNLYRFSDTSKLFYGADAFFNHSDNNYKVKAKVIDPVTANRLPQEITRFHDRFTNGYAEIYAGVKNVIWADELKLGFASFYTYRDVQNDAIMSNPFGEIFTLQNGFVPSLRYKKSLFDDKFKIDQFLVYSRLQNRVIDTCNCQYDWYGNKSYNPARNGEADVNGSLSKINFDNLTSRTLLSYQLSKNVKLEFNNVFSSYSRTGSDPFGTVYFYSQRDILSVPAGYTKWVSALGVEANFLKEKLTNLVAVKQYFYQTNGTGGAFASYDENQTVQKNQNYGISEAMKFKINEYSLLRTSVEWAYRLPEQGEVFGDGQFLLSNFQLQPEKSTNFNIGYRFDKPRKISIEPNIFYRITKDQIILVPENLIYLQYQNVEQTRGYGIEVDVNYFPTKWLQLFGNVTYQDLRLFGLTSITNRFLEDARLRNTPYFFSNSGIKTDFKNKIMRDDAIRLFWYFSYTHEYYLSNIPKSQEAPNLWSSPAISTDLIIPTQNLHSAGVNYSIKKDKISLGLEVKNIFNAMLFDNFRVQKAGRSFHIKLRYLFN